VGGEPTRVEVSRWLPKKNIFPEYPELHISNIYLIDGRCIIAMIKSHNKILALSDLGSAKLLNRCRIKDDTVFLLMENIRTKTPTWAAGVTAKF
jgi:hypothetical protein